MVSEDSNDGRLYIISLKTDLQTGRPSGEPCLTNVVSSNKTNSNGIIEPVNYRQNVMGHL